MNLEDYDLINELKQGAELLVKLNLKTEKEFLNNTDVKTFNHNYLKAESRNLILPVPECKMPTFKDLISMQIANVKQFLCNQSKDSIVHDDVFFDMIKKNGWAAHYFVIDSFHINYHTHGVMESYNHYDIQIVLPVPPCTCHHVVSDIINDIKHGKVIEPGLKYYSYLKNNFPITFKIFPEGNRNVLRLLSCDENKYMPTEEKCNDFFKNQLDDIEHFMK